MKQKRDVRFIVLGAVILLFIAGCEGDDGGAATGGVPRTPFLGGTQGLEIGFMEGLPPEEVTDGDTFPFQVFVNLKNVGEYEIGKNNAKVNLIGFSPGDFGVTAANLKRTTEEALIPRQRDSEGNVIEPIEIIIEFPNNGDTDNEKFNYGGKIAGNTPFIFRADVCYKYQTKAVSEICVLQDMINPADDAICEPSAPKKVFSSGSPLQVTSFRQNVVGNDKIQFSFDIVHSGSGNIFDYLNTGNPANCPKDLTNRRKNEDVVWVDVNTGLTAMENVKDLTCVGLDDTQAGGYKRGGDIKLISGRRTITCMQTLPPVEGRGDFKKQIDITLDFNYLDNVDREVLVKHLID